MIDFLKKIIVALSCTFLLIPTANAAPDIRQIYFCLGMGTYLNKNNVPMQNFMRLAVVNKLVDKGYMQAQVNAAKKFDACANLHPSATMDACIGSMQSNDEKVIMKSYLSGYLKARSVSIEQATFDANLVCLEGALGI